MIIVKPPGEAAHAPWEGREGAFLSSPTGIRSVIFAGAPNLSRHWEVATSNMRSVRKTMSKDTSLIVRPQGDDKKAPSLIEVQLLLLVPYTF